MRLQEIVAIPHPCGNRIDLRWRNPDPRQLPDLGVRVVRREGTHPLSINDGEIVAEGVGLTSAVDRNLQAETVYYYTLFTYSGSPPVYDQRDDWHNRAAAMATGRYDFAGQLAELLPNIYHRYDTILPKPRDPDDMDCWREEDRQRGQLRRFLDLPGSQLDQLYSLAKALLDLPNLEQVDGRLLPLLAQWIGWQTDFRLDIAAQRNEIRNAIALYETIGNIPTAEATIKRVLGRESRTKEFVHNVFLANRPERLNLWLRERHVDGTWSRPTEPLSLNFAYEGRPAAVYTGDGVLWLFYHASKQERWGIWFKQLTATGWSPGELLTDLTHMDRHPTAVLQNETLWVFWDAYNESESTWRINYCRRTGDGNWSAVSTLAFGDEVQRCQPAAVVDDEKRLWVFWLEGGNPRWQLNYNQHDGSNWTWGIPRTFPLEDEEDPRVEDDLFAIFQPGETTPDAASRIWLFWARRVPIAEPGQTRWRIAYRVNMETTLTEENWVRSWSSDFPDHRTADFSVVPIDVRFRTWDVNPVYWGPIKTLSESADFDEREPAAFINAAGTVGRVELFWSSTRDGSWSLWRSLWSQEQNSWTSAERVTAVPYSHRAPFPVRMPARTLLFHRSNESVLRRSALYQTTETIDSRYAGSTTVDTRNHPKIGLRGHYEDFQTYTYDTGQTNDDWYARDTVGIYLSEEIEELALIQDVLRPFLPLHVRPVFIREK